MAERRGREDYAGRGGRKRLVRTALAAALTFALLVFWAFPSLAGGTWQDDKFGRWYLREDGTYPVSCWEQVDGLWYYFKDSGYMATGPLELEGVQYYLEDSGAMVSGQWVEFRGEQYYFKEDGSMARSEWVDDVHYVDRDGRMAKSTWVGEVYIDEDGVGDHPDRQFFD